MRIYGEKRKSKYGKEITFLFEPEYPLPLDRLSIEEIRLTFNPSEELIKEIKDKWERSDMGDDGTKWRYEMHEEFSSDKNGLRIGVSPILYSQHFVMRKIKGLKPEEYPTPFTINTLQKTRDDKLLIAVRDLGSDQKGIAALGSGFCDRLDKNGKNLPPSHPFVWCMREMLDEGDYASILPFDTNSARFLGLVRGSNTDVAGIFYQPLNVFSDKVYLNPKNTPNGKPEHSDLWKLEATPKRLEQFLEEGGMNDTEAADHLLGGVELLIKHWNLL